MTLAVYILIRTDINMSRGKIAAQAAHGVTELCLFGDEDDLREWFNEEGQTKIALAVNTEVELTNILNICKDKKIPYSEILDEGRTEFEGMTFTVLGIGPVDRKTMNPITGHLPALR